MDEESAALVRRVVQDALDQYDAGKMPRAVFVLGCPGAGKTSYIRTHLSIASARGAFVVDTDAFWRALHKPGEDVAAVHARARAVATAVTSALVEQNVSMIMEGTGANEDILPFLRTMKAHGYRLHVLRLNPPVEECWARVRARNAHSLRVLSEDTVRALHAAGAALWPRIRAEVDDGTEHDAHGSSRCLELPTL